MKYFLILFVFICSLAVIPTCSAQKIIIGSPNNANQQDIKLAQQYYKNGEYEKALAIYEKLYQENATNSYYYSNYLNTLVALKELDTAKQLIESQIAKNSKNASYYVDLGNIYKQQDKDDEAKKQFDKVLLNIGSDQNQARTVANTFTKIEEYDYAIAVYEKIRETLRRDDMFLYEMANVYSKKGDFDNTVKTYLSYGKFYPKNVQVIKNYFQRNFKDEKQFDVLQKQLYKRIQAEPDEILYPELLVWLFTQKKDFENAIIQVKALDKRFNEDGRRVFNLGKSAITEEQYDAATEAFNYIIDKGPGRYYINARSETLRSQRLKVTTQSDYTDKDIEQLDNDYSEFLEEFGRNISSAETMLDYAHLKSNYKYDLDAGIALCDELIAMPALNASLKARTKLALGDYYLMNNETWDAVLLYSQVDKAMKDDILGEEARFKNAELSYYNGDFEWAQTQLAVLKASTTELIANDALDLSVFITDHLGLDTTNRTMEMYARGDLLILQNRVKDAQLTMDSINVSYPGHALTDNILMQRAKISIKQRNYDKAVVFLNTLLLDFGDEILADDATFMLGELYDVNLKDPEKALDYYQSVILDYTGSLYTVEARKRYRRLRGDLLN